MKLKRLKFDYISGNRSRIRSSEPAPSINAWEHEDAQVTTGCSWETVLISELGLMRFEFVVC
jgi:hypothetical protein